MSQALQAREQPITDPRDFVRAALAGDADAVEEFIAAGADVNAPVAYGETALIAAAAGHADVVRLLLRSGADVNARRDDGINALIIAAFLGHREVVRALLDYGADVTVRDRSGMTAHAWAHSKGRLEIESLLKDGERAAAQGASFEAGKASGSNAAGAVVSNAEPDVDETLIPTAKPRAVDSARTPRAVTGVGGMMPVVVPVARAAQPPRPPAQSYVEERAPRSYSLSRLILLALISGLTAGATFFTVNWMIPPAGTEARSAAPPAAAPPLSAPPAAATQQLPPQNSPAPETPKVEARMPNATSVAAERVASPDQARAGKASKRAEGKPETSRSGQPTLISAQGDSESSQRPVSERVALRVVPQQVPHPPQSAGGAGGEGTAVTVTPRPRANPQRTELPTRSRPAEPVTPPTQPASASPKKVIRWP